MIINDYLWLFLKWQRCKNVTRTMSTRIYVGFIYGVDLLQVFIKFRVDIITHFRQTVYIRFSVYLLDSELRHLFQFSAIFSMRCVSSP